MTTSRNKPTQVSWRDGAERLFNLVIALINEPNPRSTTWVLRNVEGYDGQRRSQEKQFQRDRETLAEMGLPVLRTSGTDYASEHEEQRELWHIDPASAFLDGVDFTDDEAEMLALASRWARGGALAEPARQALRKLSAAGARPRTPISQDVVAHVPDGIELDEPSLEALFRALDSQLVIEFNYYPSLVEEPVVRVLEPWAYGAIDGTFYLTGFDLTRGAQRTFRMSRIDSIEALPEFGSEPVPEASATELITMGLQRAGRLVRARLLFLEEGAWELRSKAGDEGWIGPVDRTWLVRTAAAYAPKVIIAEPRDVAQEVVETLGTAAAGGPHPRGGSA